MASFPIQEVHKLSVGKKTTSWHRFLRLVSIFFDILKFSEKTPDLGFSPFYLIYDVLLYLGE